MRAAKKQDTLGAGFADRRIFRQLASGGGKWKLEDAIQIAIPDGSDSISDSVQTVGALIHGDRAAASRHHSEHRRRRGENLVGSCSDALLQELVCRETLDVVGEIRDLFPEQQTKWISNGRQSRSTIQLEELTNEPTEPRRQMTGPPTGVSVVRVNNVFASSTPTGSVSENAAPAPGSLLIVNSPPMPRAKSRLIAKPSPTPC